MCQNFYHLYRLSPVVRPLYAQFLNYVRLCKIWTRLGTHTLRKERTWRAIVERTFVRSIPFRIIFRLFFYKNLIRKYLGSFTVFFQRTPMSISSVYLVHEFFDQHHFTIFLITFKVSVPVRLFRF